MMIFGHQLHTKMTLGWKEIDAALADREVSQQNLFLQQHHSINESWTWNLLWNSEFNIEPAIGVLIVI